MRKVAEKRKDAMRAQVRGGPGGSAVGRAYGVGGLGGTSTAPGGRARGGLGGAPGKGASRLPNAGGASGLRKARTTGSTRMPAVRVEPV